MHEPAKADITIAHRSDEVDTPPSVPTGPPAIMDDALILLRSKWKIVNAPRKTRGGQGAHTEGWSLYGSKEVLLTQLSLSGQKYNCEVPYGLKVILGGLVS